MQRAMPLGQHAFGCLLAIGMTVGVLAGPAGATQAQRLSGLDLRLGPKDVAPSQAAPLPSAPEDADPQDQNLPEIVGEIDQVQRSSAPQKRMPGAGPLENLSGSQGMLKELLENKTIPLFRVSVPPPF